MVVAVSVSLKEYCKGNNNYNNDKKKNWRRIMRSSRSRGLFIIFQTISSHSSGSVCSVKSNKRLVSGKVDFILLSRALIFIKWRGCGKINWEMSILSSSMNWDSYSISCLVSVNGVLMASKNMVTDKIIPMFIAKHVGHVLLCQERHGDNVTFFTPFFSHISG